ncbi:MAG: hypothetical protein JO258_00800 [Alphaproteobacteria bacterium]|nr:hypothetical protein [Alphaproteobacteria bacterium]
MRDLDRALADIGAIRAQLARDAAFCGYGPVTIAATGVLALLLAAAQANWLDEPAKQVGVYFAMWIGAAVVAAALVGAETVTRSRRLHSRLAEGLIYNAIQQFLPSGIAGLLLYLVLVRYQPNNLWMLPGLWQMFVSLGIFSAARSLPGAVSLVAAWYLLCGIACLVAASGSHLLSPWTMGVPFGVGQLLFAAILQSALGEADGKD